MIQEPGAADDGLFLRGDDDQAARLGRGRPGACRSAHSIRTSSRALTGVRQRQRTHVRAGVPACSPSVIWTKAILPRCGRRTLRDRCRDDPTDRRRARACRLRRDDRARRSRGRTGQDAATRRCCGRPIAMHAMRGISAHTNGFHTCRAIHLLQVLLGTIDVPGGFRFKPPFPKLAPPAHKPAGKDGGTARTRRCRACRSASSPGRRICWSTP